ncbi:MAG: hypothetical protein A2W35_16330 [Chloroflexi bacterium RBG_16_57_11]|nr:MAG: hypothetical protein A2W35_16330 [Chloroflexi bacterium RBG_16_57_11]
MPTSYLESLLGEHEKILLTTRQHWLLLAGSIFLEIILILLIFAASVTAAIFFPGYIALVVAIGFAVLLLPIVTMTIDILSWSNRQYIVTNRRVIQISGVFNKSVTDSSLEKVNDVKMVQSALGRVFDYGDIEILTASELGVNLFRRIERPVQYKIAMLNAKSQLEGYDQIDEPPSPAGETEPYALLIAQLDSLHKQGLLTEEEYQAKKKQVLDRI